MPIPKIILASQSPQRRIILATLGVDFLVVPSQLDESTIQNPDAGERARLLARAKGEAVGRLHTDAIILSADSFCVYQGQQLEKPPTVAAAQAMLRGLAGNTFQFVTGFYYFHPGRPAISETFSGSAHMRMLSDAEIVHYCAENPVTTWSGSYSPAYIAGMSLFGQVSGNLTAFTHGFPIDRVAELLKLSGALG